MEQGEGSVGSSPKSKPARQHRHHVAQLEKRSDCGKVEHANGRPTTRTYPTILEFVQSPLNRDAFAVSRFVGKSIGCTFPGSGRLDHDWGEIQEPLFGHPPPT